MRNGLSILLSNDDGVHAEGIQALYNELKKIGKVAVVAPLEERSTTGHSLTIHKPLRMISIKKDFYGVSGSPADCVYMGIRQVLKKMPDLVVSGINRGANLGQDVYYSGTVSAAREACILGLPALAVSTAVDFSKSKADGDIHYASAAKMAVKLLKSLDWKNLPKHTLLNLNVPDSPYSKVKGIQLARQGFRFYDGNIVARRDHRGKDYFWVGGKYKGFTPGKETDCLAVDQGYASLTPLKLDSTDYDFMTTLSEGWKLGRS